MDEPKQVNANSRTHSIASLDNFLDEEGSHKDFTEENFERTVLLPTTPSISSLMIIEKDQRNDNENSEGEEEEEDEVKEEEEEEDEEIDEEVINMTEVESLEDVKTFINTPSLLYQRRGTRFSIHPSDSIRTTRKTINLEYTFSPRIKTDNMVMKIKDVDTSVSFAFDDTDTWSKVLDYFHSQDVDEEVPQITMKSEQSDRGIDRSLYYKKHAEITEKFTIEKIKNTLVHRRLALYFKRKNMEYVLREVDNPYAFEETFKRRMNEYREVLETDNRERRVINAQLSYLKQANEIKSKKVKELFESLQQKERHVGAGLIFSKTGTVLSENVIEQLIHRQQRMYEKLAEMRLKYILLNIMVSDKEESIDNLNHVDEDHTLSYYEKLVKDNALYVDKIEEKEAELANLRTKCNDTIEILAHIREKVSAFYDDNSYMDDMFDSYKFLVNELRKQISKSKKERDTYRSMYFKLKEESGLLKHPRLLEDMEFSMGEVKQLKQKLEFLKQGYSSTAKKIRCIRKKMEEILDDSEGRRYKGGSTLSRVAKTRGVSTKREPTSFRPILQPDTFDHLMQDFRPTVRRINTNKQ